VFVFYDFLFFSGFGDDRMILKIDKFGVTIFHFQKKYKRKNQTKKMIEKI